MTSPSLEPAAAFALKKKVCVCVCGCVCVCAWERARALWEREWREGGREGECVRQRVRETEAAWITAHARTLQLASSASANSFPPQPHPEP